MSIVQDIVRKNYVESITITRPNGLISLMDYDVIKPSLAQFEPRQGDSLGRYFKTMEDIFRERPRKLNQHTPTTATHVRNTH
eukprot:CAMPEP_0113584916 /NCGR_PEP_ID=MMETSP0015_2-20120614/33374_1 /TAXON_ID=2838 /ORGANISM="Odontella" /LENGTH=81 /DNA_ID=CAMNT_0000490029 /DNA_START=246 /DNA_END=488 /DNA_ORIENTATION=+ /assembly_acc=CAM_ASM_000160